MRFTEPRERISSLVSVSSVLKVSGGFGYCRNFFPVVFEVYGVLVPEIVEEVLDFSMGLG
jgi:hypothetical protein